MLWSWSYPFCDFCEFTSGIASKELMMVYPALHDLGLACLSHWLFSSYAVLFHVPLTYRCSPASGLDNDCSFFLEYSSLIDLHCSVLPFIQVSSQMLPPHRSLLYPLVVCWSGLVSDGNRQLWARPISSHLCVQWCHVGNQNWPQWECVHHRINKCYKSAPVPFFPGHTSLSLNVPLLAHYLVSYFFITSVII